MDNRTSRGTLPSTDPAAAVSDRIPAPSLPNTHHAGVSSRSADYLLCGSTLQRNSDPGPTAAVRSIRQEERHSDWTMDAHTQRHQDRHPSPLLTEQRHASPLLAQRAPASSNRANETVAREQQGNLMLPQAAVENGRSPDASKISAKQGTSPLIPLPSRGIAEPGIPPTVGDMTPTRTRWCVVCMANRQEIAIDPCGHLSMCHVCVSAVKSCPVCRGPIDKALRVYIV